VGVARRGTGLAARARGPRFGGGAMKAQWPRLFLGVALLLALVQGACVVFGLRDSVAIVCGMGPATGASVAFGVGGVLSHRAFVAVAPILAFAGVLGVAVHRRI